MNAGQALVDAFVNLKRTRAEVDAVRVLTNGRQDLPAEFFQYLSEIDRCLSAAENAFTPVLPATRLLSRP